MIRLERTGTSSWSDDHIRCMRCILCEDTVIRMGVLVKAERSIAHAFCDAVDSTVTGKTNSIKEKAIVADMGEHEQVADGVFEFVNENLESRCLSNGA